MQSKEYRRGCRLVACLADDHLVVISDLGSGDKQEISIKEPVNSVSAQYYVAVATIKDELHLYSTDGFLIHAVPDSAKA